MREFGSAAKAAEKRQSRDETDYVEYKIAGTPTRFYRPGSAAMINITMMQAAIDSESSSTAQGMAAFPYAIQFITSMMDDEPARRMRRLLATEGSGFDAEDLFELWGALLDHWSNETPTKPAYDSSSMRGNTGGHSMANSRRAGSTRLTSHSTDF